jgi:hypothetical protein
MISTDDRDISPAISVEITYDPNTLSIVKEELDILTPQGEMRTMAASV